jgi:hypothetical protein
MAAVVSQFPNLFRPLMLKKQLLKNRIVFAPVSTRPAGSDGSVSPQMLAYYANMASGGAAALVTETFHVDDIASKFTVVQPAIHHDRFLPALSTLCDEIKNSGALAIAQIGHAGRQTSYQANNHVPVAPSRIPDGPTRDCLALSTAEIAAITRAFAAAALRAAELGFSVRLFEQQKRLGGLLNTAKGEPFKHEICLYLGFLLHRIASASVQVVLETPMNYDLLKKQHPDVFLDATGSLPAMPQIPSDLAYPALPVRELLLDLDNYRSFKSVIILGGSSSGCEAALVLSTFGAQVTVVEQDSCILRDLEPVSAISLQRLLVKTDIVIRTDTRFLRLEAQGVITDRHEAPLSADLVIVALGGRSNTTLKSRLDPDHWHYGINYLPVGDAYQVGKIYQAVHDSYWRVSNLLDKIR